MKKSTKKRKSVKNVKNSTKRRKSTKKSIKRNIRKSIKSIQKIKQNKYEYNGYVLEKVDRNDPMDREEWDKHQTRCFDYVTPLDSDLYIHFKFINKKSKNIVAYCTVILNDTINHIHMNDYHSLWNVCSTGLEKGVCPKMLTCLLRYRDDIFKNKNPIILSVYRDNIPAIKCYQTVGFKQFMQKENVDYMIFQ